MPDLLIRGARMPKLHKPFKVMLAETADGKIAVCIADDDSTAFGMIGEAIELTLHGDLIDRDAMLRNLRPMRTNPRYKRIERGFAKSIAIAKDMPTIVPANS